MKLNPRQWSPLAIVLGLSGLFFVLFLVISAALFMGKSSNSSSGGRASRGLFGGGGGSVGVLEVTGVIMDSKRTLDRLEELEEDSDIKAVIVRLNSPGGSVAPSQEIYEAIKRLDKTKPVIASMGSVAASGAYYIACGARKIYANPGTITGSIGVIMEFVNLAKLYDWAKVKRYAIKTGKFKDAGAEFRDMTDEERSLLQGMVDDVLGQFKKAVSEGRKISLKEVTAIADGRIFSGSQAKNVKLVDELGTLQDAIDAAAKTAGIKGKPHVVYPDRRKRRLLEMLLDDGKSEDSQSEESTLGAWIDLARGVLRGAEGLTHSGSKFGTESSPGIFWLWSGVR